MLALLPAAPARAASPAATSTTYTIWPDTATPAEITDPESASLELGVKFQTSENGYITGLRFYKGPLNTGVHVGHLWTASGTLLASVTFADESPAGWQRQSFATPVPVTAGATYVASYHTNIGRYSADPGYFAGGGVTNGPLRALADGEDGPNGVYRYGVSAFPDSSYGAANYWVDVMFKLTAADDEPPSVTGRSPQPDASGVAVTSNVSATFSEPVDPASVSFELRDASGALVPASVTYDDPTRKATLAPGADLQLSTRYTATVSGATDLAGNAMPDPVSWSFTTADSLPPPPDQGPGGPILVIASPSNPFTRYYAEILRAEGLNEFAVRDIGTVTAATLADYDVAILGDMSLTSGQVTTLSDWVTAGGNLIAMRPDKQLAGLLGLTDTSTTVDDAYLKVDTSTAPGQGIVGDTIQFHGTADRYALHGATAVATLYSSPAVSTSSPAVSLRAVGSSGGQAAAFAFDLARSIVYTRQGNPAWIGQERDGEVPVRADDMYFPDYLDMDKVAIPQADEQQRLLANLIELMNFDRKPLPRFWYFPRGEKAVVVMTGDDHAVGGTADRFDTYLADSAPGCSVDDWECIRSTSYVYAGSPLTDAQAAGYTAQGFEVGLHVTTGCADYTFDSVASDYETQLAQFANQYPSIPSPVSVRTHCTPWSDWISQAQVELDHGIRLDTNYYYWPPHWVNNLPGMFTGSGIPMRFADLDGSIVDVYQAATQMTDESEQTYPSTINALLDNALGPNGYYGAFTANMHTDFPDSPESDAIIASAQARDVPVIAARQLLEWLDGRNGSSFGSTTWNGNTLSFTVRVTAGARGLQAMVPTRAAPGRLTGITRNGDPITYTLQTIKGIEYAFFSAQAGSYAATYQIDVTAPVISGVVASPQQGGIATVTWTTDEASNSRVDYGTTAGTLDLSATDGARVTAHTITLTGLGDGTTYYFRVRSADASGNAAVWPQAADPPASFVTPAAPPPGLVDTTVADFGAGVGDAGTYIGDAAGGEVLLAPTVGTEFDGSALPTGWFATPWASGGAATVGGGSLTVDGAVGGTSTSFPPGRALEFVATFSGQANQHAGLGVDLDNGAWAIFSTGGGDGFYARTSTTRTLIPGDWFGSPHRFRIEWSATGVTYFIDGQQVASHAVPITTPMRALASDLTPGGGGLAIDWLHLGPYASAGTFTSRVLDAGAVTAWGTATWTAAVPSGTALAISVRTGNTPTPDGTWTGFVPLPSSGTSVGANARFLQYRASLSSDGMSAPVLQDIEFRVGSAPPDTKPPVITNLTATPGTDGTSARITWTTDETATSRVDYGTSAGSLDQIATDTGTATSHAVNLTGLNPATTYYFRVRSADAAGNEAVAPPVDQAPATFATPAPPDTTPPAITNVTATPGTDGTSARVTWTTDETATSRVDYGTSAGSLDHTATTAGAATSHAVDLTGLTPGTTYYFRVRSADIAGNEAVSPPNDQAPATFATPALTRTDTTSADFGAGTQSSTYVGETENGEEILNPTRGAEFGGTSLPSGWTTTVWQTGGTAVVSDGSLHLDGARTGTSSTFSAGRSVEFVATFGGQATQMAGFGTTFAASPWAAFATATTGALYASSRSSSGTTNTLLAGDWLGAPHLFRIDWSASAITFSIDGIQVARHTRAITAKMRPLASDRTLGGGGLTVDWIRMTPYSASGTFTSRVLDAGAVLPWDTATWAVDLPAGTTIVVQVRTGNTPTPGTGWSSFVALPSSGSSVSASARYLQYRVVMTRTSANTTPAFNQIAFRIGA